MMNKLEKIIKSTIGKINILSIVCGVIVVLGVVFLAVFGYSADATYDDVKTLTVRVNQYAYTQNIDTIETVCETEFDKLGLNYEYDMKGEMNGDESELVYVFDKSVELSKAVANLNAAFAEETKADSGKVLAGARVSVTAHNEIAPDKLPGQVLLRTVIAGALFGVLACLYVTIRQKFTNGLTLITTMAVSAGLTCALALITRMPITSSIVYVLFFNLLFTAVATMLTLSKVNAKQKEVEEIEAEELISSSLAIREVLLLSAGVLVALILIGAIATSVVRNFALIALFGLVAGVFSALFFAPAFYLPIKRYVDKKAAQRARYDYKKGVKETDK